MLAYYLALLAGGLVLEEPGSDYYYIVCVLLFALYCGTRPQHRWEVLAYGFGPGVCGGILSAVFGLPALWGLLVVLVGLLALLEIDRQPDADAEPDRSLQLHAP